jgi:hypothetical protein
VPKKKENLTPKRNAWEVKAAWGVDLLVSKSLAFFTDCAVELPTPIFGGPRAGRRGRKPERDLYFPNGERRPSREDLIQYILHHVLYQIDPGSDGPIFCKHVEKLNRERNKQSMLHVVMGPHHVTGVWEIVGNRRMFDVRAVYVESQGTWIPQIILSPGNYVGVGNLNGIELPPRQLHAEMVRRGYVTEEEVELFCAPSRSQREKACAYARRGIWM